MARRSTTDNEILAQIPAAVARAKRARTTEPHAASARYDRRARRLEVVLTNGGTLAVPIALVPALALASDDDIAAVEVAPAGVALHWERLDVDLGVTGLARALLGAGALMRAAGAAGGSARTSAKSAAARLNGSKGGRPKKRGGRR